LHRPAARARWLPFARLLVAFTAISAAMFGAPAAFGATWLVGDNLIQNFPLRVLVGTDLRHGHLPLWDPYLWSGSPLLAGFNAGAAYPATALFAVLPHALAWVLNQMAVEVVAAAGMVVLLRVLGRSWLAAGLGAGAFAFGGFMTAQSVHLDLVQSAAWLPWAFAALDRLAHRPAGRPAMPWVALLGGSLGLMMLTGAVEPTLDGGIVLALYAAWLAWRSPGRRRLEVAAGAAAGVVVGVLVGAAQLLPGAVFQEQSQRAMHSFTYFASGSMNKSLTILGLDPFLLGGAHNFPLSFIGTFNLPEISSYIGILPVMGLVGLLARRHRRAPEAGQWWIWYAIALVGLLLTWGGFTPFAHLAYDIPLFNRQRLLNRNLLEVDLALAVIFATWIDRMFTPAGLSPPPSPPSAPMSRRRWPARWSSDVVLPLIPPAAVVALQVTLLVGGPWFPHLLHVPGAVTRARLTPLVVVLTVPSAVAVAAAGLVVARRRLGRHLPVLLVALMAVDLLVFNAAIQSVPDPGAASSATSAPANRLASMMTADGDGPAGGAHRMGMFDPDRFYPIQSNELGQPDLTILRTLASVQGYGAVVDERYDAQTGSHLQLNLTPASLSGTVLAQLDLGVLVSVPQYFVHLVSPPPDLVRSLINGATRLPPVAPDPDARTDRSIPGPTPAGDYVNVPAPAPSAVLARNRTRTQYFGTVLSVRSVTVPTIVSGGDGTSGGDDTSGPGTGLRVGVVSPDGRTTTWLGPPQRIGGRTQVTVTVPAGDGGARSASGIVLRPVTMDRAGATGTPATVEVGDAVVRTAGQGTYRVDGSLRDIVTPPRWHFLGTIGAFCVFAQPSARGRAWVSGDASATARVVADAPWGAQTIRVTTARPATLVRSVQFAPGWQAMVTGGAGHGATRAVVVRRRGLIQAVPVPAGTSVVRFSYRPSAAVDGFAVSALGVVTVAVLALWPAVRRRRRRVRS
jgi:hypothetical protein